MKLYVAEYCLIGNEGETQLSVGVFDSKERAWNALASTDDEYYKISTPTALRDRIYVFDSELTYCWRVSEVTLNELDGHLVD